jgi:hypothetical protein
MATLLLENVPDELLSELEYLAAADHVPVAEKTVRLLQQVVGKNAQANGARVQEILDRLIANRLRPDPGGPDVVEMLREDRTR